MANRPERKQPVKKKQTVNTDKAQKIAASAAKAAKKKGGRKKKISIGVAVFLCVIVALGAIGYFFTGTAISYYYVDDSKFEDENYAHELVGNKPVKYHLFSTTDFYEKEEIFKDEGLENWTLTWYEDEDGTIPASPTEVGFDGLFTKKSLYGWLTEKNSTPAKDVVQKYEGTYYEGYEWTAESLRTRLNNGFTATSYDFAGKGRALIESDTPKDGTKVYGIYDGQEFDMDWKSGKNFEREHVWCNSLLGMGRVTGSGKNQASDLHNLRAIGGRTSTVNKINQTRSNRYFTDCDLGDACTLDKDDNPSTHNGHLVDDGFYPGDKHVGDVSRILMYMAVMYADLKIPATKADILKATSHAYEKEYAFMPISDWELLITWNELDPVDNDDDFDERYRNDIIYALQGNRNPFIDDPTKLEPILRAMPKSTAA